MLFTRSQSGTPFKVWLWKDAENKWLLKFSVLAILVSFTWLKILYPYPNFMPPDSNSYLEAAYYNQHINLWAIGYSKFVRLISTFTSSHFLLVLIQYLILQVSILYFLISLRYFFSPAKWVFRLLFAIIILNPLLVQISNFISSDSLFISLSVIWLTQLFWITSMPSKRIMFWHAIIILLAFMVRYSALYYPVISIIVITLSPVKRKQKLFIITCIVVLLSSFIGNTLYQYKTKTNTVQYSAFGGWQLASNALYGYAFAKPIPVEKVPEKFKALHQLVNQHMDSLRNWPPFLRPDNEVAVYYLWNFRSPLRVYMKKIYPKETTDGYFYRWASFGPLYSAYGRFLISHYPREFIGHYLWPNILKYYVPPTKFMGSYNLENKTVDPVVVNWFNWKNNQLPSYFKNRKIQITEIFPILFGTLNIIFLLGLLSFKVVGGFQQSNAFCNRIISIIVTVWLINMVFSDFAAPIELRYQIFPLIFITCFAWLLNFYTISQAIKK